MLLRVQGLTQRVSGQFVAVALNEMNERELVPVSDEKAREIQVEFERASPQIEAAAAAGFPVPEAIPFEMEEQPSAQGEQRQICPCGHAAAQHTANGCPYCACGRSPHEASNG